MHIDTLFIHLEFEFYFLHVLCDISFDLRAFAENALLLGDEFLEMLIENVRGIASLCLRFEQLRCLSAA